jgi:hypothetical protein
VPRPTDAEQITAAKGGFSATGKRFVGLRRIGAIWQRAMKQNHKIL